MTKDEEWLLEEKYGGIETAGFSADKERLARGEPLGYVIGTTPFLGLTIHLDSHPLIPRVETEWWIDQLLAELGHSFSERTERGGASQSKFPAGNYAVPEMNAQTRSLQFLDLCAGSGAVGCAALARLPEAQVYFGEIDPAHKTTIEKNIRDNKLDLPAQAGPSRADVRIGDLFEPFGSMTFDVIAANPPYIRTDRPLPESVAAYEPALALYGGEDGLDLLRRIASELPKRLNPGGMAWIECDSEHAEAARALFTAQGLSCEIRSDQYGRSRVLVVHPALTAR